MVNNMFILFLKLAIIAIYSSLIVVLSTVTLIDFIYDNTTNKKINKFLEHDLVRAYLILFTAVVDTLLILWFIHFIC